MRKVAGAVLGALMLGAAFTGCSNSMTKEEFKKEFREGMKSDPNVGAMITDAFIDCAVDSLDKQGMKFRRWGEVTGEDEKMLTKAVSDCMDKIDMTKATIS